MDSDAQGYLSYDKLKSSYNAKEHPRVRQREKRAETIIKELDEALGPRVQNGFVDESSFIEYYADLNACMPAEKDDYFVDMVLRTWNLNEDSGFVSAAKIKQMEDVFFSKIAQRTHANDDEGKVVR
jgi:hypothetical protein